MKKQNGSTMSGLKKLNVESLRLKVKEQLLTARYYGNTDDLLLDNVIELVKDRCTLLPDFVQHAGFFFKTPEVLDVEAVKPKWNDEKVKFFEEYCRLLEGIRNLPAGQAGWELGEIESNFKNLVTEKNIKPGELLAPLRIMLVGGKFGPAVFQIAELIGKEETIKRIKTAMMQF